MKWMAFILMMMALSVTAVSPVRTTRRHLHAKAIEADSAAATPGDTIFSPAAGEVAVSGYDKALRSRRESFFVSNKLSKGGVIVWLEFTIGYYDMSGRELNSRRASLDCDIPAGATRNLTISTWDTQQAFYYYRSQRPRRSVATPYNVKFTIDKIVVKQ